MSSVVGIDLGNKNCVLGVPATHGVDIISNQSSNRLTPTMVTYSNERRYAGELSFQHQSEFYKSTITNLKYLIGLKYDSDDREKLEKIVAFKLVKLDNGLIGVSVDYNNAELVLRPEQLIGYLLKDLIQIAKTANSQVSKCVVSVSPWWTNFHRQTLMNAVKIGQIDCLSLVNSTTAAAVTYVKTHPERLPAKDAKPVPLMLIDMGDYSMNVAIALIKQNYVQIVSSSSDQHLGGQYFTAALLPFLLEKTQEKYKINPRDNPRAWLRFQAAAEKTKKTLSINTAVQFDVPSLMNDIDVSFIVKREDFNTLIADLITRIPEPINEAIKLADIKREDLTVIEALGGGARVPLVKEKIIETVGREFTQTLNLDECFAIGSGYIGEALSGNDKDLQIIDIAPYEIKAEYQLDGETKTEALFAKFTQIPSNKVFRITVNDKASVKIFSGVCEIGTLDINLDEKKADLDVSVSLSKSSIFEYVESAVVGENPDKIVPQVTFSVNGSISKEDLENYSKLEAEMTEKDNKEKAIDNARNDLESSIFEAEKAIERDFPNSFEPSELTKFKKDVQDIHDWFTENEFDRFPIEEYTNRLESIRKVLDPVKARANKYKTMFEEMTPLKDRANNCLDLVKTDADRVDDGEKEKLQKDIHDFLEELDKALNSPKYQDPTFSSKDFVDKMDKLEARKNALEKLPLKPRPKPQAMPTKIEQPESESNDSSNAENEDEEEEEEANDQPQIIGRDFWGRPIYARVPQQQVPKKAKPAPKPQPKPQATRMVDNPEDYYYDRYGNIVGRRTPEQQPVRQQQRQRQPVYDEDDDDYYGYQQDPLAALFGQPQRRPQRRQPQQQRYPYDDYRSGYQDPRRQYYDDDDYGYDNYQNDDDDYYGYANPPQSARRPQQRMDPWEARRQQEIAKQREFERRRRQQELEEQALAERRRKLQEEERRYQEQQRLAAERQREMEEMRRRQQLNRRRAGPGFDFWQPPRQQQDPFWGGGSPFFF